MTLPDVLGTKIGRLVAAEFADPARLRALGTNRLIRFAAAREVQLRRPLAQRLVAAAADALPTRDAAVARQVLAADLTLLADLDAHVEAAETELAALLPLSPFATLTSVPGWAVVRVSNYAAALGDPLRWPGPRQIYRAAGLSPMQYESAGKRRDGRISREGSVTLRRALIDLGIGLWLTEPTAKAYDIGSQGTRQTRRDHCLRAGSPCHPHRLRTRWRPRDLRPDWWGLSIPIPCERKPPGPFTTLLASARLGRWDEGPDQMPERLWRTHMGYAASSLAPGSSPPRQPERRQMTQIPRSHMSAWAPGTPSP